MRIRISHPVVVSGMMLEIRSVHENITLAGEPGPRPPILATNVYLRTPGGWRMVLHHASPAPEGAAPEPAAPPPPPKTLH